VDAVRALDLVRGAVGGGPAVIDTASSFIDSGNVQDCLSARGLLRSGVTGQGDVADVEGGVFLQGTRLEMG
jgi:hypothetical protein